jgi:hypothetical protein
MTTSCGVPSCLQCFQPQLATVGAACTPAPVTCSGVSCASCGMAQVTVTATKTNVWPWVIAIGIGLYLLSRTHKG